MKINNDMRLFAPWNESHGGWVVPILGGGMAGTIGVIATPFVIFGGDSLLWLLLLLGWVFTILPFKMWEGHSAKRLGWINPNTARDAYGYRKENVKQNEQYQLYSTLKTLPAAVKKDVTLTIDQISELEPYDAKMLRTKIEGLVSAYEANQKALTSPHVTGLLHRIEDATNAYNLYTNELRGIDGTHS